MQKIIKIQENSEVLLIVNLVMRIRHAVPKSAQNRLLEELITNIDLFSESAFAIKMLFSMPPKKNEKKAFAFQQLHNKEWECHFISECLNSGIKPRKVNEWLENLKIDLQVNSDFEGPVLNYTIYERNGTASFILPIPIRNGGHADA